MSPLPVRVETNARRLPSGEYNGRDSVAGFETSKRAAPPLTGTVQISPPETNAISVLSGEMAGSEKYGRARSGADTRRAKQVSFMMYRICLLRAAPATRDGQEDRVDGNPRTA